MKTPAALVLAASLLANAALAWFAFSGSSRLTAELDAEAVAQAAVKNPAPTAAPGIDPETWARIKSDDLPTVVARLRAAKFPPDVIRAVMTGLVTEQFTARRRALDPDAAQRAFWKDARPDPSLQIALSRLYAEQEKTIREILGPDALSQDPLALARLRSRYGSLAPEKLDAVRHIESDFNLKRAELYYTKGTYTTADLAPLEREQRATLAAILSPAELEEFDLRSSRTGQTMRTELAAFNPTEAEFRALFQLRQAFDERYNPSNTVGIPSQEQMRERSDAQKELKAQINSLLGPARGAEYERATDYNFRQTSQLVARYELPPETATQLWQVQKEFERRRAEVFSSGSGTTREQLPAHLSALQQEAITRVTPLLGNPGRLEAYKQYGGSWLQSMVPRPAPRN